MLTPKLWLAQGLISCQVSSKYLGKEGTLIESFHIGTRGNYCDILE